MKRTKTQLVRNNSCQRNWPLLLMNDKYTETRHGATKYEYRCPRIYVSIWIYRSCTDGDMNGNVRRAISGSELHLLFHCRATRDPSHSRIIRNNQK